MGNPVFKNQQLPQSNQNGSNNQQSLDFNAMFNEFKQNPMKYLGNLKLPPDIQTPEQAVRYAAATNQIPPLIQQQVYGMLGKK
jgi:hypothetical protein